MVTRLPLLTGPCCAGVTRSKRVLGTVERKQQARYRSGGDGAASDDDRVIRRSSLTQGSGRIALDGVLACPRCRENVEADTLVCDGCGHRYEVNAAGFAELTAGDGVTDIDVVDAAYAADQHSAYTRWYERYLEPYLDATGARTIIDIGCGIGREVTLMARDGYAAFGVDVPHLAPLWADYENDPRHFVSGDATALPFRDGVFDLALSRGVIEHIGTTVGHYTLEREYRRARREYAAEVLRVLRPGGRAVVACPNKTFPVDIQHAPSDGLQHVNPLRAYVFARTGINVHKTWGAYHLLSFAEVERLFLAAGATQVRALPIKDYFSFGRFQRGVLKTFAQAATAYVDHLPRGVWRSPLNPYVIAEIRV